MPVLYYAIMWVHSEEEYQMIEIGQVLSLKIRFNNSGAVASVSHPVLVIGIDKEKNILEVAHIDSITEEKKWKALLKSNVTIRKSNPPETVIDKDSFVRIDNIIQLENFAELENKRRQTDKLIVKNLVKYYEVIMSIRIMSG